MGYAVKISMKNLLLSCFAGLLIASAGARGDAPPGNTAHGVILQYHHVADDTPAITSITPARFAEQLDWLAANDYEVWPLSRLVNEVRAGKPTPSHVVAITFDDAYKSIYTNAWPLLRERHWPFTIFVSTKFVGTAAQEYLSWDQLAEMKTHGATIANHTWDHTHLLRYEPGETETEWRARITGEIQRAQSDLEHHLGDTPKLFAYPYGEYDPAILNIVQDLGFTGFGQQSGAIGPDSLFTVLPRFPMGGQYSAMDQFKSKIRTLPLPVEADDRSPLVGDDARPRLTLVFKAGTHVDQLVCYGPGGVTDLEQTGPLAFVARSKTPVPVGRSRYNCTMPVPGTDRFYWFSQMWIRKNPDGSWYAEP